MSFATEKRKLRIQGLAFPTELFLVPLTSHEACVPRFAGLSQGPGGLLPWCLQLADRACLIPGSVSGASTPPGGGARA